MLEDTVHAERMAREAALKDDAAARNAEKKKGWWELAEGALGDQVNDAMVWCATR